MAETRVGQFEASHARGFGTPGIFTTYVTDQRLVLVRIGSATDGGRAFTAHFGLIGALISYFLDKRVQKKRAALRAANDQRSLDELLTLDAKNFELRFGELAKASLKKAGMLTAGKAVLEIEKSGEKPWKLTLQTKDAAAEAAQLLRQTTALQIDIDSSL